MMFVFVIIIFLTLLILVKLYYVLMQRWCTSKVCLVGKTAIVTGGSSGIGYQIVLGLASRGCRVIIADCITDEIIKEKIINETHNSNIILKYVNLASFQSVRDFAKDIIQTEDKIDILINNAGVGSGKSLMTEDGLSCTMQVSYYSGFLLTHLLVESLRKSTNGRIIFTTSLMSFIAFLSTKKILKYGLEKAYGLFPYPVSKFCQIAASEIFADKLFHKGITSNCFHPYAAKTNLAENSLKNVQWWEYITINLVNTITQITGKSPEEAAQTGIFLSCANEVQNVTGQFFGELTRSWKPPKIYDRELLKVIWEESERIVKLQPYEKL